ncbi:MAG: cytochrome c [Acidobacteria bacterium]|nr:cytochrome c [Acidobacteriota bacterium]MCA1637452.1 cytochrome c [Acidobacteriota bacterium]
MKSFKLGLILTAFAIFIIACNQTGSVSTNAPANTVAVAPANPEVTPLAGDELGSARKIYSEICVKCHKEDGKGGVRQIEDVKIKAPDFTSDRMKKDEDAEWIKVIENGEKEDGMPAFKGKLSDDEIKDLVKFIRKEFQQK